MQTRNYGAVKTQLTIPWLQDAIVEGGFRQGKNEADAYAKIALIYRAVRYRCNTLAGVPMYFTTPGGADLEQYPFEDQLPFKDWIWAQEAALLLNGASYTVRLKNKYAIKNGFQWLNPFTVKPELNNGVMTFIQTIDGLEKGVWTEDDMIYLREFSMTDDVGPGVSMVSVALDDGEILRYVSRFLSGFFRNGAMPATFVTMEGLPAPVPPGSPPGERERVEAFFRGLMQGVKKAFRILAVTKEAKITQFTPEIASFDIDKLDTHAINAVAWASEIPKSVLTADSANFATAETEYKEYVRDTLIPRCTFFESKLNPVLRQYDCQIAFAPEELAVMQEDESKRATSVKAYVDAGMPLLAALDILGVDLSDEAQALIEAEVSKPKSVPPPSPLRNQPPEPIVMKTALELERWMRKSVNAVKSGNSAVVEFVSEIVPEAIKTDLNAKLESAKTETDIKTIFKGVI